MRSSAVYCSRSHAANVSSSPMSMGPSECTKSRAIIPRSASTSRMAAAVRTASTNSARSSRAAISGRWGAYTTLSRPSHPSDVPGQWMHRTSNSAVSARSTSSRMKTYGSGTPPASVRSWTPAVRVHTLWNCAMDGGGAGREAGGATGGDGASAGPRAGAAQAARERNSEKTAGRRMVCGYGWMAGRGGSVSPALTRT